MKEGERRGGKGKRGESDNDGDSEIVIVKVTKPYGRVWPGQA